MELGPAEISLNDDHLAMIGRATALEAQAKNFLTLSLKRLRNSNHTEWIASDKKQFKQIVTDISAAVEDMPKLKEAFSCIFASHERWRDKRNLVVHATWACRPDGKPVAYCYRRSLRADENDVVNAMNDCWWLAKQCREFAQQIGEAVLSGELEKCREGDGRVHIKLENGSVTF
ncbi:hypothetical protein [Aurantiacibacter marinus]|uniref:Uncharacterized protein n=1 Tax=Aurantiacibacter marinus TaxID=874156 RepID=A0A0H0XM62_9SPHN|nr:hypothetical protein [Aurantiacibacter marinus]KLI63698.1 hypothetical protein AAV99_08165 [Aurantiacibacter marinus]